ncbi:hypothetical protein [Methylobacterium sp. WL8]|uniref:hypothetical protein n=1 Tax=Methylobacterium sp. WL8 TaxID=2603899 RepID=UPI0011CC08A6|nr:hypothetical protein [Methylobacterium sp. WL8]TXN80620.1 hypothetical protein FV234_16475 [Methylobacterium sp. WL8]
MNAPKPQRSPAEDTTAEAESALRETITRTLDAAHMAGKLSGEMADILIAGPITPLLAAITAERTAREEAEARADRIDAKLGEVNAAVKECLPPVETLVAEREAAEAERDRLAAALRLLLPFVDRTAGEGVMWLEDCDSPQMDAADLCIAAAEALGMELGDDAYSAILKQGEADIRAARALTSTKGADVGE